MKQIADWSRSVTFKRLQKISSLSLSELEFLMSISIPNIFFYISIYLTSKITIKSFIFTQSFTSYFTHFAKKCFNISRKWRPIYTKTDQLFSWSCELRTLSLVLYYFSLLQIKPWLTKWIRLPPCSCHLFLPILHVPLGLNGKFEILVIGVFIQFSFTNYEICQG